MSIVSSRPHVAPVRDVPSSRLPAWHPARPGSRGPRSGSPVEIVRTSDGSASDGLVVGVADRDWVVEQLSVDGPGLLGGPADHLIGSSLLDSVHATDRPLLASAGARALRDHASVAIEVHVGRPGRWSSVRLVVTPMVDGEPRLGFTISDAELAHGSARTARLEQHLERIGRELEAAGLNMHRGEDLDLDLLPGVDDLSPRQWEVLRRLLRGERVPGIARDLFISASTVRNHLTAIFAKVGVHSQEELITRLKGRADVASVGH
jgi:DNA-binding CsgD family transcriptional regulator